MNRFRNPRFACARRDERGVTILLVAIAMSFMVIAIAAIAIDVGAMYTARGEAKHAADAAALAGAKALADSGMTSDPTNSNLQTAAIPLAKQIATSVATHSMVGGRLLKVSEVSVGISSGNANFVNTPQVSVTVQRTDFPTFFAKAWGRSTVAVGATSVAEAVNPSNPVDAGGNPAPIVIAPSCVKPWILPNLETATQPFFDPVTGAIKSQGMVGKQLTLNAACPGTGGCIPPPAPAPLTYYFASMSAPPANQEPTSCGLSCDYERNIAACSPQPITCGVTPNATVDLGSSCANFYSSTNSASNCLIHSPGRDTIQWDGSSPPFVTPLSQPQTMQFIAGSDNPLVASGGVGSGSPVSSSDSLVTVPVFDGTPLTPSGATAPVNVIGFIQGFLRFVNNSGRITIVVVNMAGCGTGATGAPVVGNGISPIPVHLISP